jgi:mitogen-activated protein kinase kinase kinase 4
VADELRIFESVNHQHLVKHFGVEIHREEMLIFMEYCPEGTIEALIMSTEEGLDEVIVRRYTKQIVEAFACLGNCRDLLGRKHTWRQRCSPGI